MSSNRLPFSVEYARTNRSTCRGCYLDKIAKDELRFCKLEQSPFHDGFTINYYHCSCFFNEAKPTTTGDIENFDNLRWDDQQMIREKIDNAGSGGSSTTDGAKKGRKRPNAEVYRDYSIGYAKTDRSTCKGCEAPILKDDIRISKKDYDSEMGQKLNGVEAWHHVDCFVELRKSLDFYDSGDVLPGFEALNKDDKKTIKTKLPKIKNELDASSAKKIKIDPDTNADEKLMKKQNEELFKLKDQLATLTKKELTSLLNANDQTVPKGTYCIIEKLADLMCFGVPLPCDKCNGNLKYTSGVGYKCTGNLTEWTKCENVNIDPPKEEFKILDHMKNNSPFLSSFEPKVEKRMFRQTFSTKSLTPKKKDENNNNDLEIEKNLPLKGMQFIVHGKNENDEEEMKKKIMLLGGTVSREIHENIAAVITSKENFHMGGKVIQDAENMDIQVISDDFIDEAKNYNDTPISLLTKKTICGWGSDPSKRIAVTIAETTPSTSPNRFEKLSGKKKFKIKVGGVVDPDSELDETAHIHQCGDNIFSTTLGLTDIQSGINKYYKMQILKDDVKDEYWLFRSWGRVGTTIGGKKCDNMSLDEALQKFEELYVEKTDNYWMHRKNFVKKPNLMYPIDVENTDEDENLSKVDSNIESKLKKPVQELIRLIFDVDIMKKVMAEYELDIEKMPLGKLSKKQLQQAYSVLTELQNLIIKNKASPGSERMNLIDASNRFYTLVPHSFGIADPPILDDEDIIKKKSEMLDSLIEMEIAYNLLNTETDLNTSPIDTFYRQLNTDIDVLDKDCEEYKVIQDYTKNTHASSHLHYKLEIEDVFVIKRHGEDERYEPFKKLNNRKLLWHGSRTTNYAGILSQGLRIAPPEAPVTGYMFGKGIYFADMVSKSANYCCASSQNPIGLLMLCEVALGNMYERLAAEYVEKLPVGKHSTFGMGQTHPDPTKIYKTKDGVEVPYGPGVPAELPDELSLLYNEYIVYDVAQVKTQYLVRMKFDYDIFSDD
ncbi:poly [ADP-ribose] polymerase-like [Aphidius gifuensis]|uniref:poly [ADP-ribose] polymerase-like n=1 Tax=Aphidius gifuensis TaxID=684658 RepID=UPI001CDBEE86|nr:poly [ADP-ribose] polymerase-like [Aphidius gifuensis]